MIEFLIDSFEKTDKGIRICGAVNLGTIRLGSFFSSASTEPLSGTMDAPVGEKVSLAVKRIIAYGQELDQLPEGMSGELHLLGDGADEISSKRTFLIGDA